MKLAAIQPANVLSLAKNGASIVTENRATDHRRVQELAALAVLAVLGE